MIVKLFSTDWIRLFDAPIKKFLRVFLFKVHVTSLIEHKKPHFVESKAPVSQLVNADDTSVIEIKTQHYLES